MDGRLAPPPESVDRDDLARALQVLGSPTRLGILARLRHPTAASDIRTSGARHRPGENPERTISASAVREHLSKLVSSDLVKEIRSESASQVRTRFVANIPRLYALGDAFRQFVTLQGHALCGSDGGALSGASTSCRVAEGPRLVGVQGACEGKVFPLTQNASREGEWIVGRRPGVTVRLDDDPFVLPEHAVISRNGNGPAIRCAPECTQDVTVNWEPLEEGASHPLRPGDIVRIGRSLLVYTE